MALHALTSAPRLVAPRVATLGLDAALPETFPRGLGSRRRDRDVPTLGQAAREGRRSLSLSSDRRARGGSRRARARGGHRRARRATLGLRVALDDRLDAAALADIEKRLARLDARAPWTRTTLALIARRPRVAASKLAVTLGRETLELKADIRKLEKLGLTQSFEVGYEISPRGRAFLAARKPARARLTGRRPAVTPQR